MTEIENKREHTGVQRNCGCKCSHDWIAGVKRFICVTGQLKCDGTRAEIRFRLSAKRTSPFKSAGASVQSTTGSRGVHISGSNAGYTMFRGSVKGTGYPLHSPVSPSLPLPRVTVCHHISTGVCHLCVYYNAEKHAYCGPRSARLQSLLIHKSYIQSLHFPHQHFVTVATHQHGKRHTF